MTPFSLELDLILRFMPPMDRIGNGITVTRTIELPFPPYNGLAIYGKGMDDCPDPIGFRLEEVVWDLNRQVFLGKTTMEYATPMATIADDIGTWLQRGWRLGSYLDAYKADDESKTEGEESSELGETVEVDDDVMEAWPSMPPRKRPKHFNKVLRAIIRAMAELHNNCAVAYAMWKTQRFFDEEEREGCDSPAAKKFWDAVYAFEAMSLDEQVAWIERVKRTYPRLDQVIP